MWGQIRYYALIQHHETQHSFEMVQLLLHLPEHSVMRRLLMTKVSPTLLARMG